MKLKFRQSGGFAGLLRGCDLDLKKLDLPDAAELKRLIEESGLETILRKKPGARDLLQYEIEVDRDGRTLHAAFDDRSVPEKVRPLLSFLKKKSQPVKPD